MENKIRNKLNQYLRYKQHIQFVQSRTLELRSNICSQACMYGTVDNITRTLYLKYNNRLIELQSKK